MSLANSNIDALVQQWVRPEIRELTAYHVPEVGDLVKLDAMENPYTWPETVVEQWLAVLRNVTLNRYPDPGAQVLKERLRTAMNVPEAMDVLLGNGSDELIQIIAMAVSSPGRVILAPDPTFVMYRMIANFTGMDYIGVPLQADFSLDMDAMLSAIEQYNPAVVFISYPNNPTGNLFNRQQIERLVQQSRGLVVVDEAYHAFAQNSFMQELGRYDNVVVMRTVSKMGLAGLRLGLLAGPKQWLAEFDKVRLPYNINILTQVSAKFALDNSDVLERQTQKIRQDRDTLFNQMRQVAGIKVYPSQANFLLFRVADGRGPEVFNKLKADGVLIKNLHGAHALLNDCLRVTVGTAEENKQFLDVLSDII
jgi:histidinol-phosphate aminotransferase